jgi:hypothetical protein
MVKNIYLCLEIKLNLKQFFKNVVCRLLRISSGPNLLSVIKMYRKTISYFCLLLVLVEYNKIDEKAVVYKCTEICYPTNL